MMKVQRQAPESISSSAAPVSPVEINRSCCLPVTLLFAASIGWLLVAGVLGLISAIKLHSAAFLSQAAWLTYGRVFPAYLNVLLYGFAVQAALGIALWVLARLSRAELKGSLAATFAGLFWNIGVFFGVAGILAGDSTGYLWLEMPRYATPLLFFSYAVIGLSAAITFHSRRERQLYVSQWYLVAALFWFPWIYSTAQLALVYFPARGVVQAVVAGWFAHNIFTVWLSSIALAALFYFLPKILNRPLHSHELGMFGFWALAFFGCWGGLQLGGPTPSWLGSVSVAAGVMTLIPVLAVAINWRRTLLTGDRKLAPNPVLSFFKFGAVCYVVASLIAIAGLVQAPVELSAQHKDMSETIQLTFAFLSRLMGGISEVAEFTHYASGVAFLFLYGFFAFVALGSIYYIVPKLTLCDWPSAPLLRLHFWSGAAGVVLLVAPLVLGGVRQGAALNNADLPFLETVRGTIPFLGTSTLGLLLLFVGNVSLAVNLARLLARCRCLECCGLAKDPGTGRAPVTVAANL
ncbi:MAG: cbb3-type cytochrome c oxidase subunit I [Verrucomicrobia bacterium]|nr:cbb3-type cytochrome c oxidase subunit I [Verrucomicrobiota bacterium]